MSVYSVGSSSSKSSLDRSGFPPPSGRLGKYKVELVGAGVGLTLAVAAAALLFFIPGVSCIDLSSLYDGLAMGGAALGGALIGGFSARKIGEKILKKQQDYILTKLKNRNLPTRAYASQNSFSSIMEDDKEAKLYLAVRQKLVNKNDGSLDIFLESVQGALGENYDAKTFGSAYE